MPNKSQLKENFVKQNHVTVLSVQSAADVDKPVQPCAWLLINFLADAKPEK